MHYLNEQQEPREIVLQEALASGNLDLAQAGLKELHPSEIADLLESLPPRERDMLWELVQPEQVGEVLAHVQDAVRAALLEPMAPGEVAFLTERLDTDDAADILQDLPEYRVEEVLRSMDEQHRQRLASILSYPEDTAGGLMNTDTVTVRCEVTLDVVIRYLRWRGVLPEKTDSLIVVDRHNTYLGMLPLTTVLTGDPDVTVGEVMTMEPEAIPASLSAHEVAKLFEQRDLLSAPVIDEQGRLLGRVTIDDVVDVIRDQGDHSLMGMAGLSEEEDIFAPVVVSARRRTTWLGVNLATAFLAASVIGLFEATIQKIVALAVLMPIVAGMGGNAGIQTLTLVIRGLALGQVGSANARKLLYKELAVGCINGLLWACVVGLVAGVWFKDIGIGFIIGLAMIANLVTAALAGTLIPLALKKLDIDPAIASGVFLTAVTDVMGFMAFLGFATLFLV